MADTNAKQKAIAGLIDGRIDNEQERVAVSIHGVAKGFPATLEAFSTTWPFSVSYAIEINTVQDPHKEDSFSHAKVDIVPRVGRGLMSFFFRTFLFESKGLTVHDRKLESKLIFSYDNGEPALRFIKYPGVADILLTLERECKMKEMIVKTDAGIFFSQGVSFNELDLDMCRATFNFIGELGQILSDAF